MAPRETENNAYANFEVTKKEHYGMLLYFLEWSIYICSDLINSRVSHFKSRILNTPCMPFPSLV